MRKLYLAFIAFALAAGASAFTTGWTMRTAKRDDFAVERKDAVIWFYHETIGSELTREEAASLGRALLEAAGEKPTTHPDGMRCVSDGVRGCCIGGGNFHAIPAAAP